MTDLITLPNTSNPIAPPTFNEQPSPLARVLRATRSPQLTMPYGSAFDPRTDLRHTPPGTTSLKQEEYLQSKSAMRPLSRWTDGIRDPAVLAVYKSTLQRIRRFTRGRR